MLLLNVCERDVNYCLLTTILFCRYLVTGSSFRTLSFNFRVGVSTVSNIVGEIVTVIWTVLQPLHMPVPSKNQFLEIANDCFCLWNFANCIGCLDSKHVRIKCPEKSGSMFYNYKHFFSMVLQGLVDAHYRFIVVDVGGCGKQNDGKTFESSDLFRLMQTNTLDIPHPACLPGTNVKAPYVFVGDDAYPLMANLLKPYVKNELSFDEEMFNKRLSRMRKSVECAFGILFAKWRLLSTIIETKIVTTEHIIKCICLLHNIIIDLEGMQHHLNEAVVLPVTERRKKRMGRPTNTGTAVRDLFKTYFANNPIVFTD